MWFISLIALLLVPVCRSLPAAFPLVSTISETDGVEPSDLSTLQKALFQLDRYVGRLEKYTEVFTALRSGDLAKVQYHNLYSNPRTNTSSCPWVVVRSPATRGSLPTPPLTMTQSVSALTTLMSPTMS